MTKIDVNLSGKKSSEEKLKTIAEEETQNKMNYAPSPAATFLKHDEVFNWSVIRRVSICQMILASIAMAMLCILSSMTVHGLDSYRFLELILAGYLFMTGHKGFKGSSTHSYESLIFFMIMSALQWMINVLVSIWLAFSLYQVPYYVRYPNLFKIDYNDLHNLSLMATEAFGAAAMIGTVVTGTFGLTACCRGLSRMLARQTLLLKQQEINATSA